MIDVLNEHLEYLNLTGRLPLYRQAVEEVIQPGDTVADLGCGLGVLGLLCLEAGASEVWGIDSSDAIQLARESVAKAGLGDRYHCVPKSTFHAVLPQKVDLLICDHIGFFGFDYGIIAMLEDARRRFLKPGGAIIPQSMDLMVAGVSSDVCRNKASAWQAEHIPAEYRWLDGHYRGAKHHHKHSGDELISAAVRLGRISLSEDNPELLSFSASLSINRSGLFDGVAGWFDCALSPSVRMTNSPLDPASIGRSQAFLPAAKPFTVEAGDEVEFSIRIRHEEEILAWTISPPRGAPVQKLSTWHGALLKPADLAAPGGQSLTLSDQGAARAYVLAQVDGVRTSQEIFDQVLRDRPNLFPSEQAIRDFVMQVLAKDCTL